MSLPQGDKPLTKILYVKISIYTIIDNLCVKKFIIYPFVSGFQFIIDIITFIVIMFSKFEKYYPT